MSNEVNTTPVTLGDPEWRGEITTGKLEQIIAGLLIPNQGMSKALARKVLELEAERDALLEAITYEGAEVVNRVTAKVLAARAAGKGNE